MIRKNEYNKAPRKIFRVNPSKSLSILRAQISTDSLNDENEQLENWAKRQPFRNVNEQMLQQFKDFIDWR